MVGFLFELMCNLFKVALLRQDEGVNAGQLRAALCLDLLLPAAIILFSHSWERLTGLIYDATARTPFRRMRATFVVALSSETRTDTEIKENTSKGTAFCMNPNVAYYVDLFYVVYMLLAPVTLTVGQQCGMFGGLFKSNKSIVVHLLYNACGCSRVVLTAFLIADSIAHLRFAWANDYLKLCGDDYPRILETRGFGFKYRRLQLGFKYERELLTAAQGTHRLWASITWLGLSSICIVLYISPWWDFWVVSHALKILRLVSIWYQSRLVFKLLKKPIPARFITIASLCVLMALVLVSMFDQRRIVDETMISGTTFVDGLLAKQPGHDVLDYPSCHSRWGVKPSGGDFTAFDAALVANLAYVHDERDLHGNITSAFKDHPLGVPKVHGVQPWQTVGRWMQLEFDTQVDVFAFRGSATTLDFITDMEMYNSWLTLLLRLPAHTTVAWYGSLLCLGSGTSVSRLSYLQMLYSPCCLSCLWK